MQQHQGIEEFLNVLPRKHSVDLELAITKEIGEEFVSLPHNHI
jgi:hypothetical protein